MKISFVGCGAAGRALGRGWIGAGHTIASVHARRSAAEAVAVLGQGDAGGPFTDSDVVVFATPDDVIAGVAQRVPLRADQLAVHLSGAHASTILAPTGARTASLHPLRAFADLESAVLALKSTYFFVEGDAGVDGLARDLGGHVARVNTEHKVLYHAAAAIASNYTVTLLHIARDLFTQAGVDQDVAHGALVELVRGSIDNVGAVGLPAALTGPAARGDVALVARHLAALKGPQRELYRQLLAATVPIARNKGAVTSAQADALERLGDARE